MTVSWYSHSPSLHAMWNPVHGVPNRIELVRYHGPQLENKPVQCLLVGSSQVWELKGRRKSRWCRVLLGPSHHYSGRRCMVVVRSTKTAAGVLYRARLIDISDATDNPWRRPVHAGALRTGQQHISYIESGCDTYTYTS
jgi:hypothetical protein